MTTRVLSFRWEANAPVASPQQPRPALALFILVWHLRRMQNSVDTPRSPDRLIVALDLPNALAALNLVQALGEEACLPGVVWPSPMS